MLSVYTNQQDLLKSTNTTKVSRLESVDKELLDTRKFAVKFKSKGEVNLNSKADLEIHVYTPDGVYLTGNHDTQYSIGHNPLGRDKQGLEIIGAPELISIDTNTELDNLGIHRGQYKVVYNLFNNLLGSYTGQKLWIKEISPSRRELRIQLSDNESITLRDQLNLSLIHI
jgi:hypothetical protein